MELTSYNTTRGFDMEYQDRETLFARSTREKFAFLESQGFGFCGTMLMDETEPRDRHVLIRYWRDQWAVDIVMTSLALGLFVFIKQVAEASRQDICANFKFSKVINFEHFLLMRHAGELSPPLVGMREPVFHTLYNKKPAEYARLMAKHLPDALDSMAERLKLYGSPLLSGDEQAVDQTLSFARKIASQGIQVRRGPRQRP